MTMNDGAPERAGNAIVRLGSWWLVVAPPQPARYAQGKAGERSNATPAGTRPVHEAMMQSPYNTIRPCSGPGCDRIGRRRSGLCSRCYLRAARAGTLPPSPTPEDRLRRGAVPSDVPHPILGTPCWVWNGSKRNITFGALGYGIIRVGGRNLATHRYAWQVTFGEIPAGMDVLHRCDNPPCCNPAHLFLGNDRVNALDKECKGRSNRPRGESHYAHIHPETRQGENNGRAVLTDESVRELRRRRAAGATILSLAKEAGLSKTAMRCALVGISWKNVK